LRESGISGNPSAIEGIQVLPRQLGEFLNFFSSLQFWETEEQEKINLKN